MVVVFNQSRRKASSSSLFFFLCVCGLFEPSSEYDLLTPLIITRERERERERERDLFLDKKREKKR